MSPPQARVLDAWPELRPQAVISAVPRASVRAAGRVGHDDDRVDTVDLRLTLGGVTLRRAVLGADEVWDIAVEPSPWWHSDCGRETRWWQEPVGAGPPAALQGVLRGAGVQDLVDVRRRARRWSIVRDDGRRGASGDAAASVVLEDILIGDQPVVTTVRISGDAHLVEDLASAFGAAGATERTHTTALDVLAGRARPEIVTLEDLPPDALAGHVVRRAVAASVAKLLANDLAVRLRLGPEGVHQARVATRRLRSDLRTLGELVDSTWASELGEELRWLASALGKVRDADVLGLRLQARLDTLEPAERELGAVLLDRLHESRNLDVCALDEAMASERYARLLDRLLTAARTPVLTEAAAGQAHAVLDTIAARAWRPLEKAAKRARHDGEAAPIDEIHAVRIKAKRFRYAADAASLVEPAAQRHARRIAALQDELGELNDAATAERWLRSQLATGSADLAFVVGQLVGCERAEIQHRRQSWGAAWTAASRPRERRWLARP